MMECCAIAQQIPHRTDGSGLVVEGTEDHALGPGADEGPGAHRARLQGHDEGAAVQAPLTPERGGGGDRHELRVAERIGIDFAPIVTAPDDLTDLIDDHSPDGNVVMSRRQRRLGEGMPHPFGELSVQRAASSWSAKPTVSPTWATTRAGSDR